MPLEAGTYIDSLNASNPLGTGDPKAQGDDHLRLIKSTVKNTFPNLTGAVTATQTELNRLVGVTGVTGTGNLALSASPTFTGTLTAATVAATTLTGAGSGITALNASNLASGTVPDARFPATLPALNGSALTNLNATNLASGTVADGRLSSNVPLLNAAAAFTGGNVTTTFSTNGNASIGVRNNSTGTAAVGQLFAFNSSGTGLRLQVTGSAHTTPPLTGGPAAPSANIFTDTTIALAFGTNNVMRFQLDSGGGVTTPNTSANEVGIKGAVARAVSSSGNTAATDSGNAIVFTGGSGQTFTLDGDPPTNAVVILVNESGNNWTIAASGSLIFAGSTGSRTLPTGCMAAAYHRQGSGTWQIAGQLT